MYRVVRSTRTANKKRRFFFLSFFLSFYPSFNSRGNRRDFNQLLISAAVLIPSDGGTLIGISSFEGRTGASI